MGPEQHADVRDRRSDLQCGSVHRDYADGLETTQRPRPQLATRLQSPGATGLPHKNWFRKGVLH